MGKRLAAGSIALKRAYERPAAADGLRILVDRLWPRGVRKADAAIDQWAKDLAPSTALRKWFGHAPERWQEFCRRYAQELHPHWEQLEALRDRVRKGPGPVTLIYSAHDEVHNNAVALREFLLKNPGKPEPLAKPGGRRKAGDEDA